MPKLIEGGELLPFEQQKNSIPYHEIKGPGPDALQGLNAGDDRFLISPGVLDCIILTAVHAQTGYRMMAHYNPFSGPKADGFEKFFKTVSASFPPEAMTFSATYNSNSGSKGSNRTKLIEILANALPALESVTIYSYGKWYGDGLKKRDVLLRRKPLAGSIEHEV